MSDVPLRPEMGSLRRSPWLCAVMAAALATTFWAGLIWLAGRIVS
jgi:hypothetical protein